MKQLSIVLLVTIALAAGFMAYSCSEPPMSNADKLASWRNGIWITGGGTYTIWSATHYFVISYEGDSLSANVYCGASQVEFHNLGIAREQTIRLRKFPQGELTTFRNTHFTATHTEAPMELDTTLFTPGQCVVKDGVIYDAVEEVTDDYILLATCNGDHEKLFSNGLSVYMPAGGGEFKSYRVATFD